MFGAQGSVGVPSRKAIVVGRWPWGSVWVWGCRGCGGNIGCLQSNLMAMVIKQ